jgi:hypothetical protein
MPALLSLLLLAAQSNVTIAVKQLNRPTIVPGGGAVKVVLAVFVENTSAAPIRLTKLAVATGPTNRQVYAIDRGLPPGAVTRIPVVREMAFGLGTRVNVTIDLTIATPAGEQVESRTVPVNLRVDRAIKVH